MRLLCDTNPMAYGSTASLVAILAELGVVTDLVVIGRDVSLELLRRAYPAARAYDVDVKDATLVAPIVERERPDAALVISNHSNLHAYSAAGVPVFFVDVLFWYGERKEESMWARFAEGFALDFPGVAERVRELAWRRPPTIVGPLLRALPARSVRPSGTLINLGGVRSVFVTPERARAGVRVVAQILRSLAAVLPGAVTVAVGADAADELRPQLPGTMKVGPLSPDEYDEALQRAELLLTVPGLNAVIEGMAARVPLAFLPALNASACLQLRRYQRAGVGATGIDLDHYADLVIPERVSDERALTASVLRVLEQVASSPQQLDMMTAAVERQLRHADELVESRRAFVDGLGPAGAPHIARAMSDWWYARSFTSERPA